MPTTALICLDGYRVAAVLAAAAAALTADATWLVLHVADTRPVEEAERAMGGLIGRGRGLHHAKEQLRHTIEADEADVQSAATTWLAAHQRQATWIGARGRPEREIIRLAEERAADVVVLGGGRGLPGRYPGPGSYPLSPVARYVIDHARCDVLLLRRYVQPEDRRSGPGGPGGPPRGHGPHPPGVPR